MLLSSSLEEGHSLRGQTSQPLGLHGWTATHTCQRPHRLVHDGLPAQDVYFPLSFGGSVRSFWHLATCSLQQLLTLTPRHYRHPGYQPVSSVPSREKSSQAQRIRSCCPTRVFPPPSVGFHRDRILGSLMASRVHMCLHFSLHVSQLGAVGEGFEGPDDRKHLSDPKSC